MTKKCNDHTKIYNEKSNKCIKFNTQHFKKLLNEQKTKGEIYFSESELKAFAVSNPPLNKIGTSKSMLDKLTEQSAETKKTDPDLSSETKKPEQQVYDTEEKLKEITKKGKMKKEISHSNEKHMSSNQGHIKQISNIKTHSTLSKNTHIPMNPMSSNTPIMKSVNRRVPINVVKKLRAFVDKIKDARKQKYIARNDTYCKKKELLTIPIVHSNRKLDFTFYYFRSIFGTNLVTTVLSNFVNMNRGTVGHLEMNAINYYENNFNPKYVDMPANFNDNVIDVSWFNELNEYMRRLSPEDIILLHTYTWNGDVLVNSYLRNTFDYTRYIERFHIFLRNDNNKSVIHPLFIPCMRFIREFKTKNGDVSSLFSPYNVHTYRVFKKKTISNFEENKFKYNLEKQIRRLFRNDTIDYKKYLAFTDVLVFLKPDVVFDLLEIYANSLQQIINNAPPTKKKMTLFRGTKMDVLFKHKNKTGMYFKNDGFVSSSIDFRIAHKFKATTCCLTYITLLPGSKTIWLAGLSRVPSEKEFLLGLNTTYLIRSNTKEPIPNMGAKKEELCKLSSTKVQVTRVVAL